MLVGLIYEGEWLRFPPKLNSGAARPLPPSLFMDAFYLHRFPTILTSFLPCPVLPSLLPQFSRIDHTVGRTRTQKWSCSSSSQLPLHCTATACRAHEIELNILCV